MPVPKIVERAPEQRCASRAHPVRIHGHTEYRQCLSLSAHERKTLRRHTDATPAIMTTHEEMSCLCCKGPLAAQKAQHGTDAEPEGRVRRMRACTRKEMPRDAVPLRLSSTVANIRRRGMRCARRYDAARRPPRPVRQHESVFVTLIIFAFDFLRFAIIPSSDFRCLSFVHATRPARLSSFRLYARPMPSAIARGRPCRCFRLPMDERYEKERRQLSPQPPALICCCHDYGDMPRALLRHC